MQKGFTILELSCVLAIIGVLTAMAVPSYDFMVRRAQADEARTMLNAIAHAEFQHYRDQGVYLACEPTGEISQGPGRFPNENPCWQALGIRLDGDVRYRYSVALTGESFLVSAEGDLDRDGVTSRFNLHGHNLAVDIENEFE